VIGAIMIGHGYGKVFGGFSHVQGMMGHIGFPAFMAYPLAATEFFGGILIIAGLLTRFIAFAMLVDMTVAIWKVHWKNGLLAEGGYQFPLTLWAIAFALIFFGGGPIAIDAIRHIRGGAAKPKKS